MAFGASIDAILLLSLTALAASYLKDNIKLKLTTSYLIALAIFIGIELLKGVSKELFYALTAVTTALAVYRLVRYLHRIQPSRPSSLLSAFLALILIPQIVAIITPNFLSPVTPKQDAINYIFYAQQSHFGVEVIEHSAKYLFLILRHISDNPVAIGIFLVFMHIILVVTFSIDLYRIHRKRVFAIFLVLPPFTLPLSLLSYIIVQHVYQRPVDVSTFFWLIMSGIYPPYNLPYPFLLETFKTYIVTALIYIVFIIVFEKMFIRVIMTTLIFLIEPTVYLLMLPFTFYLALRNSVNYSMIIESVVFVIASSVVHKDRLLDFATSVAGIKVGDAFFIVVCIFYIFSIVLGYLLRIYSDNLDKVFYVIERKKILLVITMLLLVGAMYFYSSREIGKSQSLFILLWMMIMASHIPRVNEFRVFVAYILGIYILGQVGYLSQFHSFAELFSRLYVLFSYIFFITQATANRWRPVVVLSIMLYFTAATLWNMINFPGGVIDYSKARELYIGLVDTAHHPTPHVGILVGSFSPTLSFVSRFTGGFLIFPSWRVSDMTEISTTLSVLPAQVVFKHDDVVYLRFNEGELYVLEINVPYDVVVDGSPISPPLGKVLLLELNCSEGARIHVRLREKGLVRFKFYSFTSKRGGLYLSDTIDISCQRAYLVVTQQICPRCGLDSWPRGFVYVIR